MLADKEIEKWDRLSLEYCMTFLFKCMVQRPWKNMMDILNKKTLFSLITGTVFTLHDENSVF